MNLSDDLFPINLNEEDNDDEDLQNDRMSLSNLLEKFRTQNLEELFKLYADKINHGYYSLYQIKQFVIYLVHFLVLLISVVYNKDYLIIDLPDLIFYVVSSLVFFVGIIVIDSLVKKSNRWQRIQVVSFLLENGVNLFVPIYHFYVNDYRLRPAYSSLLVISCYVFFDFFTTKWAILCGLLVSTSHILTMNFLTYVAVTESAKWKRILSDVLFQLCINALGIYFRHISELVKRKSFLDRKKCVNSTIELTQEKEQQDKLLLSIMPESILDKVKRDYFEQLEKIHAKEISLYRKSLPNIANEPEHGLKLKSAEVYENVTILFADIVNYTEMTKKLNDVETLVHTLNDLFCSFDDASDKHKVTRIKFLGDCYYCVSGIPPTLPENHAEAAVDLGLDMIKIIAKVRHKRGLNVDMRIGIHSGRLIGGIIGKVKIQFDIFSKDVNLANLMESEGKPSMVHITQFTKDLLTKDYDLIKSDKRETVDFFKEKNLDTYFIKSGSKDDDGHVTSLKHSITSFNHEHVHFQEPEKRLTFIEMNNLSRNDDSVDSGIAEEVKTAAPPEPRRQSLFVKKTDQSIFLHQMKRLPQIDDEDNVSNYTAESVDSVMGNSQNVGVVRRLTTNHRQTGVKKKISYKQSEERRTAFMKLYKKRFDDRQNLVKEEMEKEIKKVSFSKYQQFVKNKDINSLMFFRNWETEKEFCKQPDPLFMYYVISELIALISVFVIQNLTLPRWDFSGWPFYLGIACLLFLTPLTCTQYLWDRRHVNKDHPTNRVTKFFYNTSKYTVTSSIFRHIIYVIACIIFSYSVLSEIVECNLHTETAVVKRKYHMLHAVFTKQFQNTGNIECVIPWHMTETCLLAVLMTFLFLKMIIWVKFCLTAIITVIYGACVFTFNDSFYENSETYNYKLKAQIAHILGILFLTFTLTLIDRQSDYMYRQDFLWNKKLREQKNVTDALKNLNKYILANILPEHVVKVYLDVTKGNELYAEAHENVAVMFATILYEVDDDITENDFVYIMNKYICEFDKLTKDESFVNKIEKIKIAKWTYMVACGLVQDDPRKNNFNCVEVLVKFASEMLKKLKTCNNNLSNTFKLRIGISHGKIVAGVVGSKKPLYDIWGHPVNMASRMDTTGIPNKIQVLKETKDVINKLGYKCDKRGKTKVKGLDGDGMVNTYFVALDDENNLIRCERNL